MPAPEERFRRIAAQAQAAGRLPSLVAAVFRGGEVAWSDAIGLAIAAEESLARLHSNGARPSGLLRTDQQLKPEQREALLLCEALRFARSLDTLAGPFCSKPGAVNRAPCRRW